VAAYGKEDFDAHINDISWSPDGRYLLTGHDNNLVLLRDAATGVLALTLKGHTESVGNVGFNRDGSRIYTGGADDTIRVWK